jgi:hypothetical protein
MRVRLTADLGGVHVIDSVMDVPEATARYLVEQEQAVPVDELRSAEVTPPRNAAQRTVKPEPRQRRKG